MPYFLSHNEALDVTDTPEHLSLHLPYVIGYSVDSSHQDIGKSAGIFIVLSNIRTVDSRPAELHEAVR